MMQENLFSEPSVQQLKSLLDNNPAAIFVSDINNHKVLYANRVAVVTLSLSEDMKETCCYHLAGFDEPCPFCHTESMNRDTFLNREYYHPVNGRVYQLNGKIMNWGDSQVHIEYMTDITEQRKQTLRTGRIEHKMQDIINAIPGGVAIYRVSDSFETVYFSEGVPKLSGYTAEEYEEIIKQDAIHMTYASDADMVAENLRKAVQTHSVADFEFRKQHKDGHIVWVHIQAKLIGEDGGYPLLQCVFHNITAFKETQQELEHLVNSIPGGIVSYQVKGQQFIPLYFSAGVSALTGHTGEELEQIVRQDALGVIDRADRHRITEAVIAAVESGETLDISYRAQHKDGNLVWLHLNGRRMGPRSDTTYFYAVVTGMSAETQLFQSIADESADAIYVVDRSSYELLYVNEPRELFAKGRSCIGRKCYEALHGGTGPCAFCVIKNHAPDGKSHEMAVEGSDRFYSARCLESDWNGIPAYVQFVRDMTEEVQKQNEKVRLEQYFQSVIRHLPGGVAVVRYQKDGSMIPEFLSEGFSSMTGMSSEGAWHLYQKNAMSGVHPDDRTQVTEQMAAFVSSGNSSCELIYRLKKGGGGYLWVKNSLSMMQSQDGECRIYASYYDITRELEEREQLSQQYRELIMQHYRTPIPNALIVGHCNITQNQILEIIDYTDSALLEELGNNREMFFRGLSELIQDAEERSVFLQSYLNAPALEAFRNKRTEITMSCFIKLPKADAGCYVRFNMHLVEVPDTGEIAGILTVTDITEQMISERILHRLSVANCDLVVDADLLRDRYAVINGELAESDIQETKGCHSERLAFMLEKQVVPRDKAQVVRMMNPDYMMEQLKEKESYSFHYSIFTDTQEVLTKRMTVFAIDLRLGRVCFARADITDSVREQQGLLNVVAYTFELLGMLQIDSGHMTLYTRKTVLENLPPFLVDDYSLAVKRIVELCSPEGDPRELEHQFELDTMLQHLAKNPKGYDFVFSHYTEEGLRYKQVAVMWGDSEHKSVCMVRADVTDMLAEERRIKNTLEQALTLAEEASQAKTDFLSSMSHDIRTPMNAIMGMTTLAGAHLRDTEKVADCLQKISLSSRHLLSLVNDILDMSKIESGKITLNRMEISVSDLLEQVSTIIEQQAVEAGIEFHTEAKNIEHEYFCADALRINQILLNLLSNAVKFTPEGGSVRFQMEEMPAAGQPGYVRYRFIINDMGIGIPEDFLAMIFHPFARSRETARVEGTGLGLSIVKGLVDLMGGIVSVESKPGSGSTFYVELECEAVQNTGAVPEKNDNPASETGECRELFLGRRILVAEDNSINAEILCGLLDIYGAQTVVRADGAQTVREFLRTAEGTYDAILMDIQMPVMDGYAAARAIRELNRPDAKTIPVIAMTANAFSEDVQAALEAGMNAHVAKPIDIEVLKSTLQKAFRGEKV